MAKFVVTTEWFEKIVKLVEADNEDSAKWDAEPIETVTSTRTNTTVLPYNDGQIKDEDIKEVKVTTTVE